MPARRLLPRLWLRKARKDSTTGQTRRAVWIIIHDGRHIATGCLESEIDEASRKLQGYIVEHYRDTRRERELNTIDVADVLDIYVEDRGDDSKRFLNRIGRLNEFWGGKKLSEVTGENCRKYAKMRGTTGARRELEDLRAAINPTRRKASTAAR